MACFKTFSLSALEDDTSLEAAIYSGAHNAIFGVRNQWVYRFNATTGKKEAEAVFASDVLGPTSICELAGVIYVCAWWSVKYPVPPAYRDNHDIFTINPTTLAATNTHIWKTYQGSFDSNWTAYGPYQIVPDEANGRLWGLAQDSENGFNPFFVTPAIPAGLEISGSSNIESGGGAAGGEIIYDDVNNVAVFARQDGPDVTSYDTSGGFPPTIVQDTGGLSPRVCGICYCPTNNTYYAVDSTSLIVTIDATNFATIGSINTGVALANPRRIRFNAQDGKLYVPGYASNSIIVIDPLTNLPVGSPATGFSLPWDFVVSATGVKFAVQNSSKGLQLIT